MQFLSNITRYILSIITVGSVMLMGAVNANAQSEPDPAEVDALIGSLEDATWIKICGVDQGNQKNVCTTRARELVVNGQVIAVLQLVAVEGEYQNLITLLPTGLQIPDGIRVQVDGGQPITGRFRICFPNNCLVEAPANQALVDSMKRGQELIISAQNQAGRPVPFKFSLAGFTKAIEGEGIDAQVFAAAEAKMREQAQSQQQQSNDLQNALQRKANEARPQ
jgi:invasion protein IalB